MRSNALLELMVQHLVFKLRPAQALVQMDTFALQELLISMPILVQEVLGVLQVLKTRCAMANAKLVTTALKALIPLA